MTSTDEDSKNGVMSSSPGILAFPTEVNTESSLSLDSVGQYQQQNHPDQQQQQLQASLTTTISPSKPVSCLTSVGVEQQTVSITRFP